MQVVVRLNKGETNSILLEHSMSLLHKTITSYLYTTDNDKNVITIIKYLIPVNIPQEAIEICILRVSG